MTKDHIERVDALVEKHGKNAPQLLIDEIVAAVRAGDDATVTKLDKQLRHAERLIEKADLIRTSQS